MIYFFKNEINFRFVKQIKLLKNHYYLILFIIFTYQPRIDERVHNLQPVVNWKHFKY